MYIRSQHTSEGDAWHSRICCSRSHQLWGCWSGHWHVEHWCHLLHPVSSSTASHLSACCPLLVNHAITFNLILIWPSCRLSGESPFQGESDTETLALVTAAKWEFDEESFEEITDLAKDFISSLLSKDVRCFIILHFPYTHHTDTSTQIHNWALNPLDRRRMSCEDAMAHAWLAFTCVDNTSSATKNLPKNKMKKFLTRQKWKVILSRS